MRFQRENYIFGGTINSVQKIVYKSTHSSSITNGRKLQMQDKNSIDGEEPSFFNINPVQAFLMGYKYKEFPHQKVQKLYKQKI